MSYKTSAPTPRRTSMPAPTSQPHRRATEVTPNAKRVSLTQQHNAASDLLPAASSTTPSHSYSSNNSSNNAPSASSGTTTGASSSSMSSSSSAFDHQPQSSIGNQYMMYSPMVMTPISQLPTGPRRQSRPTLTDHNLSRNPDDYNADGSLRTMHRLPRFDEMYAQAQKTRYVRPREPFQWEKSLTIKEVFDKK